MKALAALLGYLSILLCVFNPKDNFVTLFWKTIHLGTLANSVFYSYNEALSSYLPCVKIL